MRSEMSSYLPLIFTFVIAIVGGFFDTTDKQATQAATRLRWLPRLTRAGAILTCIYLSSLFFSLFAVRAANQNSMQKDQDDQAAKKRLVTDNEELQRNLAEARSQISQLAKFDFDQFQGITVGLKLTTAQVTGRLTTSSKELSALVADSSRSIDTNVRGSLEPLRSFFLTVFFAESSAISDARKNASVAKNIAFGDLNSNPIKNPLYQKGGGEGLAFLSTLACKSPVPVTITMDMSLAETPSVSLRATASKTQSTCTSEAHLEAGGGSPRDKEKAVPHRSSWEFIDVDPPTSLIEGVGQFDPAQLDPITVKYPLTATDFRRHVRAIIYFEGETLDGTKAARKFLEPRLPLAVGFHLAPGNADFDSSQAYLLDSRTETYNNSYLKNGVVSYFYEPGQMRPEWARSWAAGSSGAMERVRMKNAYRAK